MRKFFTSRPDRRVAYVCLIEQAAGADPFAAWYHAPAASEVLAGQITEFLAGKPRSVAKILVSVLNRAEAEAAGYAYASQLPEAVRDALD